MKKIIQSTIKRTQTPYRPAFHFSPPRGWMNDPNGLLYTDGIYHLYYQHYPHSNEWGPMHWGHACSDDLLHWQDLPIAFEPEGPKTDYYSGCAVLDSHNSSGLFNGGEGIVAIYTHRDNGVQEQALAYSVDGGLSFTPYAGNPIIKNPGIADFRDPKVFWHQESGRWCMVLALSDKIEFYSSSNLLDWEKTQTFKAPPPYCGSLECPDLFMLREKNTGAPKWVLMYGDYGLSRTFYFIGQFDGKTFTCDDPCFRGSLLDYGYDNYSGNTFNGTNDGRKILISWLNSTFLWNCTPTGLWRGINTIPRELSLIETKKGQFSLVQWPVSELESERKIVYTGHIRPVCGATCLPVTGKHLDVSIRIQNTDATMLTLYLAAAGAEYTKIGVDFIRETVFIDRTSSGDTSFASAAKLFPLRVECPVPLDKGEIELRILLDACSVEVFVNHGLQSMSALIFPKQFGENVFIEADGKVDCQLEIAQIPTLVGNNEVL